MKKIFVFSVLMFVGLFGYSQTNKAFSNTDFLNEFFNDLKSNFHLKDTILISSYSEVDSLSFIRRDTLFHFFQEINEPRRFITIDKEERDELNKRFNYKVNWSKISNTNFILIPVDSVRSINGDKINREKRIKEFVEKYKTQDYYIFSEPLLLKDKNYCFFEYEIGGFFKSHSNRNSTIFKKVNGRWMEWIIFSWKHEF